MKKLITRTLIFINVVIIIGMIATGFAYYLNPLKWGWLAELGYGFPAPLIANILMIVVWVIYRSKYVLIPFVGMIICYVPVMKYCPVNPTNDSEGSTLRVMSYNTLNWGQFHNTTNTDSIAMARHDVMDYILNQKPDIVCLQETRLDEWLKNELKERTNNMYPYMDSAMNSNSAYANCLVLLSRYPIKKKEKIDYYSLANLSCAFTIDMNGKDVIILNNHLETNALSIEEKENFQDVMHGNQGKKALVGESKFMAGKLNAAAKKRVPQVQAVAEYKRMHEGVPMILCGDFNDIPLTYTYYVIVKK